MACAPKMNANPNSKQILTTNHKSESKVTANLILSQFWMKSESKMNANLDFELILTKGQKSEPKMTVNFNFE